MPVTSVDGTINVRLYAHPPSVGAVCEDTTAENIDFSYADSLILNVFVALDSYTGVSHM